MQIRITSSLQLAEPTNASADNTGGDGVKFALLMASSNQAASTAPKEQAGGADSSSTSVHGPHLDKFDATDPGAIICLAHAEAPFAPTQEASNAHALGAEDKPPREHGAFADASESLVNFAPDATGLPGTAGFPARFSEGVATETVAARQQDGVQPVDTTAGSGTGAASMFNGQPIDDSKAKLAAPAQAHSADAPRKEQIFAAATADSAQQKPAIETTSPDLTSTRPSKATDSASADMSSLRNVATPDRGVSGLRTAPDMWAQQTVNAYQPASDHAEPAFPPNARPTSFVMTEPSEKNSASSKATAPPSPALLDEALHPLPPTSSTRFALGVGSLAHDGSAIKLPTTAASQHVDTKKNLPETQPGLNLQAPLPYRKLATHTGALSDRPQPPVSELFAAEKTLSQAAPTGLYVAGTVQRTAAAYTSGLGLRPKAEGMAELSVDPGVNEAGLTGGPFGANIEGTTLGNTNALQERLTGPAAATRHPARQLAEAILRDPLVKPETELIIAPEELGKVRFAISQQDGIWTIAISADRADTLALLRRNADMLAADLAQSGLDGAALDFGSSGRDRDDGRPSWAAQPMGRAAGEATESAPQAQVSRRSSGSRRLDLRL